MKNVKRYSATDAEKLVNYLIENDLDHEFVVKPYDLSIKFSTKNKEFSEMIPLGKVFNNLSTPNLNTNTLNAYSDFMKKNFSSYTSKLQKAEENKGSSETTFSHLAHYFAAAYYTEHTSINKYIRNFDQIHSSINLQNNFKIFEVEDFNEINLSSIGEEKTRLLIRLKNSNQLYLYPWEEKTKNSLKINPKDAILITNAKVRRALNELMDKESRMKSIIWDIIRETISDLYLNQCHISNQLNKETIFSIASLIVLADGHSKSKIENKPSDAYRLFTWERSDYPIGFDLPVFYMRDPAFLSFCKKDFSFENISFNSSRRYAFTYIANLTAVDISPFSIYKNENEVLIPPSQGMVYQSVGQIDNFNFLQAWLLENSNFFSTTFQSYYEIF